MDAKRRKRIPVLRMKRTALFVHGLFAMAGIVFVSGLVYVVIKAISDPYWTSPGVVVGTLVECLMLLFLSVGTLLLAMGYVEDHLL